MSDFQYGYSVLCVCLCCSAALTHFNCGMLQHLDDMSILRHCATHLFSHLADSCAPMSKLTPSLTHGEVYTVATCHECSCHDGFVNCTKTDVTRDCPELTCHEDQRVTEEGTCCPVCRGETRSYIWTWWCISWLHFSEQDYCGLGHDCHHRAECKNGIFNYSCHCQSGFKVKVVCFHYCYPIVSLISWHQSTRYLNSKLNQH